MLDVLNTANSTTVNPNQRWLQRSCHYWAYRLSELLQRVLGSESEVMHPGLTFLKRQSDSMDMDYFQHDLVNGLPDFPPSESPLGRLVTQYQWNQIDISIFLIAGLAEIHEGYADVLKMVNPENQPFAATGLVAQLFGDTVSRDTCESNLLIGSAVTSGAISVIGDGPLFTRYLKVSKHLWSAINGIDIWPEDCAHFDVNAVNWGLQTWLQSNGCQQAIRYLQDNANLVIQVQNADTDVALNRAMSLALDAGCDVKAFAINQKVSTATLNRVYLHCCLRNILPILKWQPLDNGPQSGFELSALPLSTILVVTTAQDHIRYGNKPLINISSGRLGIGDYQRIWSKALPEHQSKAQALAARFPVEPNVAQSIAADLFYLESVEFNHIADQIRSRVGLLSGAGVSLVKPRLGWDQLILPDEHKQQLRESINRLENQSLVLNTWGFLKGRRGATGVRLLLAGAPGTGKTLSAEVLAYQLGVELMVVDISRVVSKWIGETEKNLEKVFQAAEQSRAALLFDEADALFGKRTEVNDASDRNANLETAYLLTRLENFEGLVVMSTNMRNNIDQAFLRRLDYIIDFNEPNRQERKAIWECHIPKNAPLDKDVDFAEIAAMFPVVGGIIRNASVAAAYIAAADGRSISKMDLVTALKREYEKQGKAFPMLNTVNQGPSF